MNGREGYHERMWNRNQLERGPRSHIMPNLERERFEIEEERQRRHNTEEQSIRNRQQVEQSVV